MVKRKPSTHTHGASDFWERPEFVKTLARERQALGRRLRALRTGLGMSQETAAEAMGIHQVHVSRIEQGLHNATFAILVAASLAYRVPISALFSEE